MVRMNSGYSSGHRKIQEIFVQQSNIIFYSSRKYYTSAAERTQQTLALQQFLFHPAMSSGDLCNDTGHSRMRRGPLTTKERKMQLQTMLGRIRQIERQQTSVYKNHRNSLKNVIQSLKKILEIVAKQLPQKFKIHKNAQNICLYSLIKS